MMSNKYKYAFCDMSYLLVRSVYAVSKGHGVGEYGSGDVIRLMIQTINKIARDYGITADRFIFLADKWSSLYGGYYRNYMLKGKVEYKGTRVYLNEWDLERMRQDPNVTPEELKKAELDVYSNKVKREAKKIIMDELPNLGISTIAVPGFEADDIAFVAACMLYNSADTKPSVIITKDSDQTYCLTPRFDYFKLPVGGSEPQVITYDEMYQSMPQEVRAAGVSLYDYHSILDSLGKGHNDLKVTAKPGIDTTKAILNIVRGNYEDVEDVELFKLQMKTFDLSYFPMSMLDEVKQAIMNLEKTGRLGTVQEFNVFCNKHNISGISDRYFSELIGRFDQKLFSE